MGSRGAGREMQFRAVLHMLSSHWSLGEPRVSPQQLPVPSVTHVPQHGPSQPGGGPGSGSDPAGPGPDRLLLRVLLLAHALHQRAPEAELRLPVRLGGVRSGLR